MPEFIVKISFYRSSTKFMDAVVDINTILVIPVGSVSCGRIRTHGVFRLQDHWPINPLRVVDLSRLLTDQTAKLVTIGI